MKTFQTLLTAMALASAAHAALAAEHTMPMPPEGKPGCSTMAHTMAMAPKGDRSPSSMELQQANTTMHQGMDITYTGNADVDFLKGMIAHHQGAVDMAEAVLKYGKDTRVNTLAQAIIKAQTKEIADMKSWLQTLEPGQK